MLARATGLQEIRVKRVVWRREGVGSRHFTQPPRSARGQGLRGFSEMQTSIIAFSSAPATFGCVELILLVIRHFAELDQARTVLKVCEIHDKTRRMLPGGLGKLR